ncbi:Lrp/AsnC family transcriptional regulator [Gynuella sunshinyii]|uniref:Transcriptional regulator n=1 Tax=Gynuella sunshinyii YC6258 TaxID=1445510 RepID=A0A0C5UYU2_9GAMM|nr:Lrp/AsnC family transcriptional regulator [Gynuella sunshinyii]AJQ92495.1 transcriptional regulator [Gynuella sunshinyii YC6258]
MEKLDKTDLKILSLLQQNAALPVAEIAPQVNLSVTPCWRRIQRLEREGYIRNRVALLDHNKLNVGVTVFVAIKTRDHSIEWLEKFRNTVQQIPEILSMYRLSGSVDYLLHLVLPDIAAYDKVYKQLIAEVSFQEVSSMFSMEEMKATTAIPLNYYGPL